MRFILTEIPEPVSRSTYVAVQRGEGDIPLSGLQKPAPSPSAHKGKLLAFALILAAAWDRPRDMRCTLQ